jgi:RNA recognition motif-containing protein
MSSKLYVGNLPDSASEASLQAMFAPFGTVLSIRLAVHRETGIPRGFGFVRMADKQASRDAIFGLNEKEVNGQVMTVKAARTREERR